MKHHLLTWMTAAAFALAAECTFAEPAADDAWKKVDEAINSIKKPANRPKSREEAITNLKTGLTAFDAAMKDFTAKAPADPRRWEAKLFEAQAAGARTFAGMPAGPDAKALLEEILKATDASASVKGQASGMQVLDSVEAVDGGSMPIEEWNKLADAHLKAYPEAPFNRMIEGKKASLLATAELKSKPVDIKFTAVDGTEVDLAKMRGKVILVDFWATWCGPCVAELPNVLKAYEKLHAKGFEIVGISLDQDKAKLEAFVKDKGMTWPQFFDGKGWQNEISTRYGINSIPAMWLIDKKGMLVSTSVRGKLEQEVEKHLAASE